MRPDLFNNLPSEITTNILLRVSVRSIAISKCVCKPWLHLLKTNDFIKSHFTKSTPALAFSLPTRDSNWFHLFELEEDELDVDRRYDPLTRFDFSLKAIIVGSASGLLLLHSISPDYSNETRYVCNPITREFCLLRCPAAVAIHGFGVSRISGQYKVVCIDRNGLYGEKEWRYMCHVYTLGTGSWRLIEATDSVEWLLVTTGAFVNGNLHWMVTYPDGIEWISCFDLETECFSSFTVPPLPRREICRQLYSLRDSIGFCGESSDGGGIAIWMMKEYGDEKSWTMEYVITLNLGPDVDPFEIVHPSKVFENGDVLMVVAGMGFMYYSNKTDRERNSWFLCCW